MPEVYQNRGSSEISLIFIRAEWHIIKMYAENMQAGIFQYFHIQIPQKIQF